MGGSPLSTFFIVNPVAGRGRGRQVWEQVRQSLDQWGEWDFAFTRGPADSTTLARDAVARGFKRVVALGGDGTMLEVLNGLVGSPAAMGIIAAGTGNDYAREAGIPSDPQEAAGFAMTGRPIATDVGEVILEGRRLYYLNVAGVGFDAEVARAVNRSSKRLGGTLPYLQGLVTTLWRYRPVKMEILLDGQPLQRSVFLAAVGLSRSFGGGMRITPDAKVDDGQLDLCIAGDLSVAEVLALLPRIYRGGHKGHPKVEFFRCREVEFRPTSQVAAQADGEVVGFLPARVRVIPGGIQLVADAGAAVRSGGTALANQQAALL